VHQHVVVVEIAVLIGAQVLEAEGVLAEDADMLVASVAADGGAFFPPGTLTPPSWSSTSLRPRRCPTAC
jgi:hypothetical protein